MKPIGKSASNGTRPFARQKLLTLKRWMWPCLPAQPRDGCHGFNKSIVLGATDLRVISLKARALLHHDVDLAQKQLSAFKRQLAKADIVLVQEVHGSARDVERLIVYLPRLAPVATPAVSSLVRGASLSSPRPPLTTSESLLAAPPPPYLVIIPLALPLSRSTIWGFLLQTACGSLASCRPLKPVPESTLYRARLSLQATLTSQPRVRQTPISWEAALRGGTSQ
jgi:hypothetical protein